MDERIIQLRDERAALIETFRKRFDKAVMETQEQVDAIDERIAALMTDEKSIPVVFMHYEDKERVESEGRLLLSDDEERNRFFRFCIGYHKELDEYTPFYHIHDHYPYNPHKIEKSLDIRAGAYRNLFVDDYVYKTVNGELAVKFGNLKMDSWNTAYECVLTTEAHANPFSSTATLISVDHRKVQRYEGNAWYHRNRIIGEY